MNTRTNKTQKKINQSVANSVSQKKKIAPTLQLKDNRPETIAQQNQFSKPIQKKENNTGLPDNLKSGIENISGYSMDDVKVHYNSDKPAQLHAHAYAQGSNIHLAPGQEKHLPHETWHVVQQKQGRVKPTTQLKGDIQINDDKVLENEADVMGYKSLQMKRDRKSVFSTKLQDSESTVVIQRVIDEVGEEGWVQNTRTGIVRYAKINTHGKYDLNDHNGTFMEEVEANDQNWNPHPHGQTGIQMTDEQYTRQWGGLYNEGNAQYMTQADGRPPTIYFQQGDQTGRIRQQHPSGPLIQQPREDIRRLYLKEGVSNNKYRNGDVIDPADFHTEPVDNTHHYECKVHGDGRMTVHHKSQGRVVLQLPDQEQVDEALVKASMGGGY